MTETLAEKIRTRQARVGVIGLGYVGLPLAVEFAKAGLNTVAFDVDVQTRFAAASRTSVTCLPKRYEPSPSPAN